jgi:DNA-binding beta-propeller fold protein YncE
MRMRTFLIAVAFTVSASALGWCQSAFGLTQRGHVLVARFGSAGSNEGQLSSPAGVAVSDATGDVYVVDRGNNRVEQFSQTGAFVSAWGWGVKDGAKEYEVCEAGERCRAGIADSGRLSFGENFRLGAGQFLSPDGIAIDNSATAGDQSSGDVYVVADVVPEHSYVEKFSASGEYLGRVTTREETEFNGDVKGVAVGSNGVVWVLWSDEEVTTFNDALHNAPVGEPFQLQQPEGQLAPGLAVGSSDELYVSTEPEEAFSASEQGVLGEEGRNEAGVRECEIPRSSCSVGELTAVAIEEQGRSLQAGEALRRGVDRGIVRGLAVDPADGDLYVARDGEVDVYAAGGKLVQSLTGLSAASGVAIASDGTVFATDAASGQVDVFGLEGASAPSVDEVGVSAVGVSSATLGALIDPKGAASSVVFEYGSAPCSQGGCAQAPIGGLQVAAGFGDTSVSTQAHGLEPGHTYHVRVRAENMVDGQPNVVTSVERTFMTYPSAASVLPDGRGWELVSPSEPEKAGASFEAIPEEGGVIEAAAEGGALTFISSGADGNQPEGSLPPYVTQNLSRRSASGGWSSEDIALRNAAAPGVGEKQGNEYRLFSPSLSAAVVAQIGSSQSPGEPPPLSEQASEQTPYVRSLEGCAPAPSACYTPLVSPLTDTASPRLPFGKQVHVSAATPDLAHVLVSSTVPLTSEPAAPGSNLYEWNANAPAAEQLRLVNVAPGGAGVLENAGVGGRAEHIVRNAVSANGQRVFFTAGLHLYMRDTATGETIQVDRPQEGVVLGPQEEAIFQSASTDGSTVFFTDVQRLTSNSTASPEFGDAAPDLYECEIKEAAGKLQGCQLTDLSVDPNAGEHADVLGFVPGTSEEGSIVYFVANGVLSSAPSPEGETAAGGDCNPNENVGAPPPGTCNLYVEQRNGRTGEWETPRLVALLSAEDVPDWGMGPNFLANLTSRVSPDGRYLAFMSDREPTGYDNRDTNPAAGEAHDEEVFLYDQQENTLVCASCDPSGARPAGVYDQLNAGEGLGLLVDRELTWEGRWLAASIPGWTPNAGEFSAYQSRYLNNQGRLFFNSADVLLPQVTTTTRSEQIQGKTEYAGVENVYEYEPTGLGSCSLQPGCLGLISSGTSSRESAFLDASETGDDAFFLTASALVPQDTDDTYDIYDAHVCTSSAPCPPPPAGETSPCETADSCRPSPTQQPALVSPASAGTHAPETLTPPTPSDKVLASKATKPLSRAQRLADALKTCRKLKRRKQRARCETAARRNYAPKQTHARKSTHQGKSTHQAKEKRG